MCRLLKVLTFISVVVVGQCAGQQCCVSSKFSTGFRIESAKAGSGVTPRVDITDATIDYDRDNKIEIVRGTVESDVGGPAENTVNFTVINDYGNGKSYNFGNYYGYVYCNVSQINMDDMNDGCVPKNYNLTATFPLGSGSNSVMINVFEGMDGNVYQTFVTTVKECNPITITRHGALNDGTYIKENIFYMDFVQNATHAAGTFKIPDNCKTSG